MGSINPNSGRSDQNNNGLSSDAFTGQAIPSSKDDGGDDGVDISTGQKMLSAISGSLLTSLIVTPLDVVRVRLQSQGASQAYLNQKLAVTSPNTFRPTNLGVTTCCREVFFMNNNAELCVATPRMEAIGETAASGNCAVEQTERRTINSTFDGIRKIARNEGVTTLWRGLPPTLVMTIPANIIYFTGYDWLRFNKASPVAKITSDVYTPLVAGSLARIVAVTAVSPIDLFRTRLIASVGSTATDHMRNTLTGIKEMVAENGCRSLWRGLTLTLWRDVPFSGMYWWGYETIHGKLKEIRDKRRGESVTRGSSSRYRALSGPRSREKHAEAFMDSFTAGAVSGAFASIVTMPFDVGKTRTQVFKDMTKKAVGKVENGVLAPEKQSIIRLLQHIISTQGVAGLWRGWIPRTLKVAPSCAIMISSYEVGKRVFRSANERAAGGEGTA
ncbi:hypothetical protein VE02_08556 [Pseudogymnoascus sp. 03VT05]|nr:hypothetical protein VE02_08556 [Pseudogymnoascus sp. 03VT05]